MPGIAPDGSSVPAGAVEVAGATRVCRAWCCRACVSSRHHRVARPVGRRGKVVARVAVKGRPVSERAPRQAGAQQNGHHHIAKPHHDRSPFHVDSDEIGDDRQSTGDSPYPVRRDGLRKPGQSMPVRLDRAIPTPMALLPLDRQDLPRTMSRIRQTTDSRPSGAARKSAMRTGNRRVADKRSARYSRFSSPGMPVSSGAAPASIRRAARM